MNRYKTGKIKIYFNEYLYISNNRTLLNRITLNITIVFKIIYTKI